MPFDIFEANNQLNAQYKAFFPNLEPVTVFGDNKQALLKLYSVMHVTLLGMALPTALASLTPLMHLPKYKAASHEDLILSQLVLILDHEIASFKDTRKIEADLKREATALFGAFPRFEDYIRSGNSSSDSIIKSDEEWTQEYQANLDEVTVARALLLCRLKLAESIHALEAFSIEAHIEKVKLSFSIPDQEKLDEIVKLCLSIKANALENLREKMLSIKIRPDFIESYWNLKFARLDEKEAKEAQKPRDAFYLKPLQAYLDLPREGKESHLSLGAFNLMKSDKFLGSFRARYYLDFLKAIKTNEHAFMRDLVILSILKTTSKGKPSKLAQYVLDHYGFSDVKEASAYFVRRVGNAVHKKTIAKMVDSIHEEAESYAKNKKIIQGEAPVIESIEKLRKNLAHKKY